MDFSIVIPAYNEAHKIKDDVNAANHFLTKQGLKGEIIVVDDGSQDDTAKKAREVETSNQVKIQVIRYENNKGKGFAVKTGMLAAVGNIIMFADSGLCIPYDYALKGLSLINNKECDIAIGTRRHKNSVIKHQQSPSRQFLSKAFRTFINLYIGLPQSFTDTQCGFKIYTKKTAHQLFSLCQSHEFMFDIEILLLAFKHGYRVLEFPVTWKSDPDSRVLPHHNALGVLREIISIKRNMKKNI